MKKNTIIFILTAIFVLGIGAGVYFYFQSELQFGQPKVMPAEIPTPKSTSTLSPMPTKILPEDWEIYTSQQHKFQIAHPPKMEVSTNPNEGARFLLNGPTQAQETEVTDGILLIINSGAYQQNSLQEFVRNQADELVQDPVTESVSEVGEIEISGISGYGFDIVGFSESTYYYLDKGENEFLRIIEIVQDPTGQGFKETVDQIFSTLIFI